MSSFSYLGDLGFSYKPLTFENHIKVQLSVSSLLTLRYRFRLRSSSWSQDHFFGPPHSPILSTWQQYSLCNMPVLKGEPYNTQLHQVV